VAPLAGPGGSAWRRDRRIWLKTDVRGSFWVRLAREGPESDGELDGKVEMEVKAAAGVCGGEVSAVLR
jgi:hypothetical protein